MWNSFSRREEVQISKREGVPSPLSGFRTIKSLDADGEGTITETPVISTGNGAHSNSTEPLSLCLEIVDDRMNFLLLLAKRFG